MTVALGSPVTATVTLAYNVHPHAGTRQQSSYTVTPQGAGQASLVEHFQYRDGGELTQVAYSYGAGNPQEVASTSNSG